MLYTAEDNPRFVRTVTDPCMNASTTAAASCVCTYEAAAAVEVGDGGERRLRSRESSSNYIKRLMFLVIYSFQFYVISVNKVFLLITRNNVSDVGIALPIYWYIILKYVPTFFLSILCTSSSLVQSYE